MRNRILLVRRMALTAPVVLLVMGLTAWMKQAPSRPEGPCDIYAAGGSPCAAAHSSTRALYAAYNGPLYQVVRQLDGRTLNIGVIKPHGSDPGGYADAIAQDDFCANTYCWVAVLYDQSGKGNHLTQAPRGGFSGPAMGGFNNIPVADMAPITIMGHKAYGLLIEPGMGLRLNDAKGTAVDDQAEGQYWVVDGHHYNNGCCYDYGNAETDSRDDGDGTMETTYFGNADYWYHGPGKGPWIMTDQENNLVGCVNPLPTDKTCTLPLITWRFVTAMADGEPHHWRSMGGDAQRGSLDVMFDGTRIRNERNSYDPMRKQGAILLGNGGDNSVGSQGTFYEGAMTAGGTFPTRETNARIQANIVAAKYDLPSVRVAPASATDRPPGLQTFTPGSSQETTLSFTNTTGAPVNDVSLRIDVPKGWQAVVSGSRETSKRFPDTLAAGEHLNATFTVTSGSASFNGDLTGKASWMNATSHVRESGTTAEKVRDVSAVRINEFRISDGSPDNSSNSFIELYNAGNTNVDISNWALTQHPAQVPIFSSVTIPTGTTLAAHGFYLLGLSNSGLAVPAKKGESTLFVRNTAGMSAGDVVQIGTGASAESRNIASVGAPAPVAQVPGARDDAGDGSTIIWQPLPEGPVITVPKGATNIPVVSVSGFATGQKIAIGYGNGYPSVSRSVEKYQVATITSVGKPGTQAWLSADARAGSTNIKVSSVANISVGDRIRLDIASRDHGIETVTVAAVGTQSSRSPNRGPFTAAEDVGTGLELTAPLEFNHSANMPFSVNGTGISFTPAASFAHSSNEPVVALRSSITLDRALANSHEINTSIRDAKVTTAGYQEAKAPDLWFGGPALAGAGTMSLRDAHGNVVDGLNYGGVVDPWLAEGYQADPAGNGNFVPSPGTNARGGRQGGAARGPDRSAGRFPDGNDTDDNRADFFLQSAVNLSAASAPGASNVKVGSVADLRVGQRIIIGSGANAESAVIATVGTAGATTTVTAASAGTTVIAVANSAGFEAGQNITIGSGTSAESMQIASVSGARRGGAAANRPPESITLSAPLRSAHDAGEQLSGSGITFAAPLARAHDSGALVASSNPTPGAPNQYTKRP